MLNESLCTMLQKKDLSAAQGYNMAMMAIQTLEGESTNEKFEEFLKVLLIVLRIWMLINQ